MRRWRDQAPSFFCVLRAASLMLVLAIAPSAPAQELAVDVVNASTPTLCAENDNVDLRFFSAATRRFAIEAIHPAYIGAIAVDHAAPDFSNCEMGGGPGQKFEPRRITLYETLEWQLVGHVLPNFWRTSQVPVRVGEHIETGLHLLQLWRRFEDRAEEALVLYPPDGYWRARPLPPARLRWSAYGSSFLLGPVETEARPFVDIVDIAFEPATRSFRLLFRRGGAATLRLASLDQDRIVLEAGLDPPIGAPYPFAALRSMFVTEINADAAHVAWRGKNDKGWHEAPIMNFARENVIALWTGRTVLSRHNLSAPDLLFRDFGASLR
jgi:hypothetical protein